VSLENVRIRVLLVRESITLTEHPSRSYYPVRAKTDMLALLRTHRDCRTCTGCHYPRVRNHWNQTSSPPTRDPRLEKEIRHQNSLCQYLH
jgi:hypothetical protein